MLERDESAVESILESLGFDSVVFNSSNQTFRFAREQGRNPSSVILNLDGLKYKCFSTGEKGNLFSLIMKVKKFSFTQALEWAVKKAGISRSLCTKPVRLPFGGFFKNLTVNEENPEDHIPTYSENELDEYIGRYSWLFWKDRIDIPTQKKYQLGYDLFTNRTTIPIRTVGGELMGIMGRKNDSKCEHEERWLPIIPCQRSYTLFGYSQNYMTIQEKNIVFVVESEKGVMQLDTMGIFSGVATCGCNISSVQTTYLKSLKVDRIVIAYDEGLDEDQIREQAKKLTILNPAYKNAVGYIYDSEHEVLPKDSKMSPTDQGVDAFKQLLKKVTWLNND